MRPPAAVSFTHQRRGARYRAPPHCGAKVVVFRAGWLVGLLAGALFRHPVSLAAGLAQSIARRAPLSASHNRRRQQHRQHYHPTHRRFFSQAAAHHSNSQP